MSVKTLLKSAVFLYLDLTTREKKLRQIQEAKKLTILGLHKVSPVQNPFYPALHPDLFEELLRFITRYFEVTTFGGLHTLRGDKPPLILSFDDGFADFLEFAIPLLEKYHVSVNQNIIPSCVISGKPAWDVWLGDLLMSCDLETIKALQIEGFSYPLTSSNRAEFGLALTKFLKAKPKEAREILWQNLQKTLGKEAHHATRMLTADEIKEIAKVHEIGAHSYSHESMGQESESFFEADFLETKRYFEQVFGLALEIYAFPSGSYREEQLDFLEAQGIKHVLLVNEGYSRVDASRHARFTYYANSKSEVRVRALGWSR